jgi:hypothetical protein
LAKLVGSSASRNRNIPDFCNSEWLGKRGSLVTALEVTDLEKAAMPTGCGLILKECRKMLETEISQLKLLTRYS